MHKCSRLISQLKKFRLSSICDISSSSELVSIAVLSIGGDVPTSRSSRILRISISICSRLYPPSIRIVTFPLSVISSGWERIYALTASTTIELFLFPTRSSKSPTRICSSVSAGNCNENRYLPSLFTAGHPAFISSHGRADGNRASCIPVHWRSGTPQTLHGLLMAMPQGRDEAECCRRR